MKVIVDGIATEYDDQGRGPVILFLHGWKDSLHTFDPLIPNFNRYRIVRLDLPGFGGSDMPKETWDISRYVQFAQHFISKLQLDVDTLIGHSFGGRIIIRGVGSGILKPRRIVLIAAAGLAKRRTLRNAFFSGVAQLGKFVTLFPPFSFWRNRLRRKLYEVIGSDYFSAGALKDTFVKVVSEDLAQFAAQIKVPTLVIWGRDDVVTPLEQAHRVHDLVQGSDLQIIENAGHFVHQEQSEQVAEQIQAFI